MSPRRVLPVLALGAFLTAAALAQPPEAVQPVLAFEPQAVVATGLTPGGPVVWFGVARSTEERSLLFRREQGVGTASRDGGARFELSRPMAGRSLWFAVDLATGAFAVGSPGAEGPRRAEIPPEFLAHAPESGSDRLEDGAGYLEVLLVRPEVGAWGGSVGDGGPEDEDGAGDGRLLVAVDRLEPVRPEDPPSPAVLTGRDFLILVDPYRAEYSVLRGRDAG